MSLLLLNFIAQGLIEHSTNSLRKLEVVVSQHVCKRKDKLTIVTHDLAEVDLVLGISHDLDDWSKDEAKDSINHGYVRQLCRIAAQKAPAFVIIVLASIGDVRQLISIGLKREVVD